MNPFIFLKHLFLNILKIVGAIMLLCITVFIIDFLVMTFGPEAFLILCVIALLLSFAIVDAMEKAEKENREKRRREE